MCKELYLDWIGRSVLSPILSCLTQHIIVLHSYVLYCCLIRGSATLGQYLDLQPSAGQDMGKPEPTYTGLNYRKAQHVLATREIKLRTTCYTIAPYFNIREKYSRRKH